MDALCETTPSLKAPGAQKARIVVCMGSSCFARGNEENLRIIESFLKRHGLDSEAVELAGTLCEGACGGGPNLKINGRLLKAPSADTLDRALKKELLGI